MKTHLIKGALYEGIPGEVVVVANPFNRDVVALFVKEGEGSAYAELFQVRHKSTTKTWIHYRRACKELEKNKLELKGGKLCES